MRHYFLPILSTIALLLSVVSMQSCKDDVNNIDVTEPETPEETYPDIELSETAVVIMNGKEAGIEIKAGSGEYEATSNNAKMLTVELEDNKVTFHALQPGNASATIKDVKSEKTVNVEVEILKGLTLDMSAIELEEGYKGTVTIMGAQNEYAIKVGDESVATATLNHDGSIIVTAIAPGTTTLTVIDMSLWETETMEITVCATPTIYFEHAYRFSSFNLLVDAAEEDRENVWIDFNNDGIKQAGEGYESITFGQRVKYPYDKNTNTKIRIYGRVTNLEAYNIDASLMDCSKNPYLQKLRCSQNKLEELDLSGNPELTELNCSNNSYLTSLNLSANTKLTKLNCTEAKITKLDLSNCPDLVSLDLIMTTVEEINFGTATKVEYLNIWANELKTLDISNFKELTFLNASRNKLTALNTTANTKLTEIWLSDNTIVTLDLSANAALINLGLYNCGITDASFLNAIPKPELLKHLQIEKNGDLASLNVSRFTNLVRLDCYSCNINGDAMTTLVNSLPVRVTEDAALMNVIDTSPLASPVEKNAITAEQIQIIKDKMWTPKNMNTGGSAIPL